MVVRKGENVRGWRTLREKLSGSGSRHDTAFSGLFPPTSTAMCLPRPSIGHHTSGRRRADAVRRRVESRSGDPARVHEVLADVPDSGRLRHGGRRAKSSVEVVVELGVGRRAGAGATTVFIVIPVGARQLSVAGHHLTQHPVHINLIQWSTS